MDDFLMRIGSEWKASSSGQWIESENPYTGKPWARVPRGNSEDAEAAVLAAHEAFTNGRVEPFEPGPTAACCYISSLTAWPLTPSTLPT